MISITQATKPISIILLAEDNLEHCFFFKKALHQVAPDIQYNVVHDRDLLMPLLQSFTPDLLFLDLIMPCKNGVECIKEIRENKIYDDLPIVVFTISTQANAIQTAYGFGANLYFVKPTLLSQLVSSLQHILSMDWSDPRAVAEKYFRDNKYIPYEAA